MTDPIVLHDNPNPTGEFPNNVAIHSGFNDTHELKVEGPSLVGQPINVTGPARKILIDPPLNFDLNGNLTIDLSALNNAIAATQASLTALQGQLANDEATIAALTASNAALQTQVNSLQYQILVLQETTHQYPTGQAIFTGVGSLTASLTALLPFAVTAFAGSGNFVANSMVTRPIFAAFAGAGSLHADVSGPRTLGVFAFGAAGSLTADIVVAKVTVANLAGTGGLSAQAGIGIAMVPATMTASGSLSASLFNALFLQSTLAGSGGFSANLAKLIDALSFNGVGTLAGALTQLESMGASFAGSAALAAPQVQLLMPAQASLSGSGSLISASTQWMSLVATWPGVGTLLPVPSTQLMMAQANLSGSGNLINAVTQRMSVGAAWSGTGALAAVPSIQLMPVQASLSGSGSLIGVSNQLMNVGATTWSSVGTLAPVPSTQLLMAQANLSANGSLTSASTQWLNAAAAWAGNGTLLPVPSTQLMMAQGSFAGNGSLTADIIKLTITAWAGSALFAGAGALIPAETMRLATQASLVGTGALTITDLQKPIGPVLFAGAGSQIAQPNMLMGAAWRAAGAGHLTFNVTQLTAYSALDPANQINILFTKSNRDASCGNSSPPQGDVRGTKSQSSGKLYFECTINTLSNGTGMGAGVCTSAFTFNTGQLIGQDQLAASWGVAYLVGNAYYQDEHAGAATGPNTLGVGTTPVAGDVIGVAVDFSQGAVYCHVNGTYLASFYNGGGSFNSSYIDFSVGIGTTLYPLVQVDGVPGTFSSITINVGNAAFKYALPSGFTAWG